MNGASPRINNLKVHVVLTEGGVEQLKIALLEKQKTSYNNFDVVRGGHTYIVFPKKGFVNITGIKSFSELTSVIPQLCQTFGLKTSEITPKVVIDNISAAGNFGQRVSLVRLQQIVNKGGVEKRKFFSTHFDRNFFPGAFCKTRGLGTITLFPSGKYVVVGAKCLEHVEQIFQEMSALIPLLLTTEKTNASAQTVG